MGKVWVFFNKTFLGETADPGSGKNGQDGDFNGERPRGKSGGNHLRAVEWVATKNGFEEQKKKSMKNRRNS